MGCHATSIALLPCLRASLWGPSAHRGSVAIGPIRETLIKLSFLALEDPCCCKWMGFNFPSHRYGLLICIPLRLVLEPIGGIDLELLYCPAGLSLAVIQDDRYARSQRHAFDDGVSHARSNRQHPTGFIALPQIGSKDRRSPS